MKIGCAITMMVLGLSGIADASDDDLPQTLKFSRYEQMLKHSPFAVASATALPAATPDFAKDLYVANAAHSKDGDFVTLASTTDKNLKEYLSSKEAVDGYSISNIQWSDQVGETKVTISKSGQFATLTFNEALLSQGIQNPAGAQPPVPQPPRPNYNYTRTMPAPPGLPTPMPHTRPVIRRHVERSPVVPRPPVEEPQG